MSGSYFLYGSILEKCGFKKKKRPFFRADMVGLGKYHTGGYGRIGVYRVPVVGVLTTLAVSSVQGSRCQYQPD